MKQIHHVLLSCALVLCFYGVSFGEADNFKNFEIKSFEGIPGSGKNDLQEMSKQASGGVNFNFTNYTTSNSGYESKRAINLFAEGEDIVLVSEAYCGNTGVATLVFLVTLPAGGAVVGTFLPEFNVSETGSVRFAIRLTGGLPVGMYRLQVVTILNGNWVVSPDGYSFWVQ